MVATDALTGRLTPIVRGLGYELLGIERGTVAGGSLVRLYIDGDDGIGIEDCELVSRQISDLLDVEQRHEGAEAAAAAGQVAGGIGRHRGPVHRGVGGQVAQDQLVPAALALTPQPAEVRRAIEEHYDGTVAFRARVQFTDGGLTVLGRFERWGFLDLF